MSQPALTLAVTGASGRMGQAVMRLAAAQGFRVVGAIEHAGSPALGRDAGEAAGVGMLGVEISPDVGAALLGADCVIDFSSAGAVARLVQAAAKAGVAIVSGTTGIDPDAERALTAAASRVPVLWSPNMSVGVHVLAEVVKLAARALEGYDIEIVETHHRKKVDAPSGTAKRLFEAVCEVRAARAIQLGITGREGTPGPRTDDEIGMLALRGGDVIGDHTVHLMGEGERLELTHRATSRDVFARGALACARSIAKRAPGRYTMADVV